MDNQLLDDYLNLNLKRDISRVQKAVIIYLFPLFTFLYSDYVLFQFSTQFFLLLLFRSIFLGYSLYFLIRLKHLVDKDQFTFLAVIYIIILYSLIIYINSTRPSNYALLVVLDMIFLITIFVLFPIGIRNQLRLSILFAGLELIIINPFENIEGTVPRNLIVVSYIFVILIGYSSSNQMIQSSQENYILQQKQSHLIKKLEKSIKDVKTLEGLLPICARCKKIRNEVNKWETIEYYISQRSNTQFTHSLCDECSDFYLKDLI